MANNTASAKAKDQSLAIEKKSGSRKTRPSAEPSLNMEELRALADLMIEHGFSDFEFENENIRVRLSKMTAAPAAQGVSVATQTASTTPAESPVSEAADPDAGLHKITSPIVGTFYRSPGPDKEAYVSEGSKVSPESTVCIVEAMKLMNEIQAEVSGRVVKVYVENGQPVEYGQPLFGIKK